MLEKQKSFFRPHLQKAHSLWKEVIQPGDTVIDATCGNGNDTLVLANLTITPFSGAVFAFDIQDSALEATKIKLKENLPAHIYERITFQLECHSNFPSSLMPDSIALIVYNLGYLPGGNKSLTTNLETTLTSIKKALTLMKIDGMISVTCYPGHEEGQKEESALIDFVRHLDPKKYQCEYTSWINRPNSPTLLIIYKR